MVKRFNEKKAASVKPPEKKPKTAPTVFQDLFDDAFDIPQPEAKKFLPPNAYVWRSVSGRSGWHGHLAPNPRVGCPFGAGAAVTCKEALRRVCIDLWRQHFRRTGADVSSCPFDFGAPLA